MSEKVTKILTLVGKISAIVVLSLIALLTGAAVWHCAATGVLGVFWVVISVLNLGLSAFGIYKIARKLFPKKVE